MWLQDGNRGIHSPSFWCGLEIILPEKMDLRSNRSAFFWILRATCHLHHCCTFGRIESNCFHRQSSKKFKSYLYDAFAVFYYGKNIAGKCNIRDYFGAVTSSFFGLEQKFKNWQIANSKCEQVEMVSNQFTSFPTRKWTGERVAILITDNPPYPMSHVR